jgi:hypothetical protein
MKFRFIRVFLGAPGGLSEEQDAYHEAVGACNEEQGLAIQTLLVPLTASRKTYPQGVIDENIRACTYFLLAVDDTLGIAGNTFEHDWWLARQCCADSKLPMRAAVALFKKQFEGRPPDPVVERFRASLQADTGARCLDFRDVADFRAQVHGLLSGWLAAEAPETARAAEG